MGQVYSKKTDWARILPHNSIISQQVMTITGAASYSWTVVGAGPAGYSASREHTVGVPD